MLRRVFFLLLLSGALLWAMSLLVVEAGALPPAPPSPATLAVVGSLPAPAPAVPQGPEAALAGQALPEDAGAEAVIFNACDANGLPLGAQAYFRSAWAAFRLCESGG